MRPQISRHLGSEEAFYSPKTNALLAMSLLYPTFQQFASFFGPNARVTMNI